MDAADACWLSLHLSYFYFHFVLSLFLSLAGLCRLQGYGSPLLVCVSSVSWKHCQTWLVLHECADLALQMCCTWHVLPYASMYSVGTMFIFPHAPGVSCCLRSLVQSAQGPSANVHIDWEAL